MLIFGGGALSVPGVHGAALALAKSVNAVKDGWNGFNVVHFSAARMGALMLGYSQPGGIGDIVAAKPKLAFFLVADAVDFSAFPATFKVYVGHHGTNGAHAAAVLMPPAAWPEKDLTPDTPAGRRHRQQKDVFP